MEIKIDNDRLTARQIESLKELDEQLKQKIHEICSSGNAQNLKVEYGTALLPDSSNQKYKLDHNASFGLSQSYTVVDAVTTLLKRYFNANAIQDALFVVKIKFSQKAGGTTNQDSNQQAKPECPTSSSKKKKDVPVFMPAQPRYSFNQIVLPERVYIDLMNAVKFIKYRDLIYRDWGYQEVEPIARCVINMYGPAGTGKTMCAHAIAHHVGKQLLALNYSEIESKYLGEAAKNLTAAFETARETDSVLFFDEADSFLGKRVQNVMQSSDQALNSLRSQMLILLEKFDGIVIFATNLVSNFDEAFMSRIQKHIRFEFPNASQRAEIVKKQIPSRLPLSEAFTESDYANISEKGDGLSGREIKNAIFEMLLQKAGENDEVYFSAQDFADALNSKVESNKQIEAENNRMLKERIKKKMAEKIQEQAIEKEAKETAETN